MTVVLHVIRLAIVFVLWAGPLVASVQAAENGVWASAWANPFDGTFPPAEEEEPGHSKPETAKEATTPVQAGLAEIPARARWLAHLHESVPEPPFDGAPTPPPDAC